MNSVITPTLLLDSRTVAQIEYLPRLDTLYKDGKESDFPCPNQLLEAIIRVNHARALSRHAPPGDAALDDTAARIFRGIASFNAAAWTRNHVREFLLPTVAPAPSPPAASDASINSPEAQTRAGEGEAAAVEAALEAACAAVQDMCEDLTKAFQHAATLYCVRTLHMDRPADGTTAGNRSPCRDSNAAIDVASAHASALDMLLAALHRLWARERAPSWCGKLSFWPLFVAGMEVDPGPASADERAFICDALRRLVFHLGDLSPLDAASELQLVWRETARPGGRAGQQASWDERLMLSGVCGSFFS